MAHCRSKCCATKRACCSFVEAEPLRTLRAQLHRSLVNHALAHLAADGAVTAEFVRNTKRKVMLALNQCTRQASRHIGGCSLEKYVEAKTYLSHELAYLEHRRNRLANERARFNAHVEVSHGPPVHAHERHTHLLATLTAGILVPLTHRSGKRVAPVATGTATKRMYRAAGRRFLKRTKLCGDGAICCVAPSPRARYNMTKLRGLMWCADVAVWTSGTRWGIAQACADAVVMLKYTTPESTKRMTVRLDAGWTGSATKGVNGLLTHVRVAAPRGCERTFTSVVAADIACAAAGHDVVHTSHGVGAPFVAGIRVACGADGKRHPTCATCFKPFATYAQLGAHLGLPQRMLNAAWKVHER